MSVINDSAVMGFSFHLYSDKSRGGNCIHPYTL